MSTIPKQQKAAQMYSNALVVQGSGHQGEVVRVHQINLSYEARYQWWTQGYDWNAAMKQKAIVKAGNRCPAK